MARTDEVPALTRRTVVGGAAALAAAEAAIAAPVTLGPAPGGRYPDAQASDPVRLGWMQGSPPPPDKIIRFADGSSARFPQIRWSYSHIRETGPTAGIPKPATTWALPRAHRDEIDRISFDPQPNSGFDGPMTWAQSLDANYTDGIVILHRGRIVYERYMGALAEGRQHIAFSATKSFVGTLVATLAEEGKIDLAAPVMTYLPELKGSGFDGPTVRHLLDMRSGIRFNEDYTSPTADIALYTLAANFIPRPAGYAGPIGFAAYLPTVGREAAPGGAFHYQTANTEVLGWLLRRATGMPVRDLISQRIWAPMGAEFGAYFCVDELGFDFAGGGLCACLRDMARFGEVMRLGGVTAGGTRIVPEAVVRDIEKGGDKAAFVPAGYVRLPGGSYRTQWWHIGNEHGAYSARGVHGQAIYVDPRAEMVIARFASHPMAANANLDPTSLPAYHAVAKRLMAG
jgi:CubicO group peptidase (beta-lactamase class C family)